MRPHVQLGRFIGDANRRKGAGSSNTVGGSRTAHCIRYTTSLYLMANTMYSRMNVKYTWSPNVRYSNHLLWGGGGAGK